MDRESTKLNDNEAPTLSRSMPDYQWTFARLYLLFFSTTATAIAWAGQVGYSTPELERLGMSTEAVSLVWLAGPMAGIIVQPIVGMLSDRCTSRWGRRRPFIAGGAVCSCISLVLFSNASRIGELLGDDPAEYRRPVALVIASFMFCCLDCSFNAMMAPTRALISDMLPSHVHGAANSMFAIEAGVGKMVGYMLGAADLRALFLFQVSEIESLYYVISLILLAAVSITLKFADETPLRAIGRDTNTGDVHWFRSACTSVSQAFLKLLDLPIPIRKVFAIQFCNMFAWFTLMIYGVDWFCRDVMGGDPSSEPGSPLHIKYMKGIHLGNLALCLMSLCSALFSIFLPSLMQRFTLKTVYFLTEALLTICLFSSPFIPHFTVAVVLYTLLGFPFAATNAIPWVIVTTNVAHSKDAGRITATFNLSQCLPDVLICLLSGPVLATYNDRVSALFVLGGIGALLSTLLIAFFSLPNCPIVKEDNLELEPLRKIESQRPSNIIGG